MAIGEYEADKDKLTSAASCLGRNTFTSAIIGSQRTYIYYILSLLFVYVRKLGNSGFWIKLK